MSNADTLRDANPWQPMTRAMDIAVLGKLAEELNECATAISRCIIQGIDECEPVTGKPNREWVEDEIADVSVGLRLAIRHFELNAERIDRRFTKKMAHLQAWHKKILEAAK